MAQPALSIQIKELEAEVGVNLLKRGNRKINLTAEGQYFYQKAWEILSLVNLTKEGLDGVREHCV